MFSNNTARELQSNPKVPRPSGSGTKPNFSSANVVMFMESFHRQQRFVEVSHSRRVGSMMTA